MRVKEDRFVRPLAEPATETDTTRMNDGQIILAASALLGLIFGAVFADGGQSGDRFALALMLTPPLSLAMAFYLIGLAGAELAVQSFFIGQGALIISLIVSEGIIERRKRPPQP